MEHVTTSYGAIPVAGCLEWYPDGRVKSCAPAAEVALPTSVGPLVPQYSTDDLRKRTVQAVLFYENGQLRSIPLEQPTPVDTPAGRIMAELVTFHPDGSLSRVFPLNGKLSGYWTQEDEGRLAQPVTFASPLGPLSLKIIGLSFYPEGALHSITLWPGETLEVPTPAGTLAARVGVSFRPDGCLRCLEPAKPQSVPTPVGSVMAYDLDAVGISGDANSLAFAEDGTVARVATSLTSLRVGHPDGTTELYSPGTRESLCGDADVEPVPLLLEFGPEVVALRANPLALPKRLAMGGRTFRTEPFIKMFANPFGKRSCGC
jgi:hypothetical protein